MGDVKKPTYGIDAPSAPFGIGVGACFLLAWAIYLSVLGTWWALVAWIFAVIMVLGLISYLYTTLIGKFVVWRGLLDDLQLTGGETVLDAGCGRGAVLLAAAERLPNGRAVGVDLWRSVDQSGNAESATMTNAQAVGVADRVQLVTGDLRDLPWQHAEFELVVSALAVHNIKKAADRARAIKEMARVLKPGGRLVVADIANVANYAETLRTLGFTDVAVQPAGWRYWFSPWVRTKILRATKQG